MKRLGTVLSIATLSLTMASSLAVAQPAPQRPGYGRPGGPPPPGYVQHNDWRRGRRMPRDYWRRARRIDYRRYRLSRPPRGYEWRESDGNFVLAAVATGLIASVVAASAAQQ